jgi:FMN reductase
MDLVDADLVRGKPALLAATGGTERHSLVIEHALRPLCSYLGAVTVPTGVYAATGDFGGGGSGSLGDRIARAAGELAALVDGTPLRSTRASGIVPFADLLAATRPDEARG